LRFREAKDIAARIIDMEIPRAPRARLEWFHDRRPGTDELLVELVDSRHGEVRVEMLAGLPVGALCFELGTALQMDSRVITRDARIEAGVDEVSSNPRRSS
jgi:hypothetical protein